MHDRDELHSELGLHITGDMFDSRSDGIPGGEWRVHDDTKALHLEISLVQGFKGTSIIKIVVKWYSEVGVRDGSDES